MQEAVVFDLRLEAIKRRVRLLIAERAALVGGTGAAALCLGLAALDKFRVVRVEWVHIIALVAAGLACGWVWGFLRRLSDFDVARAAEKRLVLKERLSSAVSLRPLANESPMVSALTEDAGEHLEPVSPSQLFPRRFGKRGQAFLGLLLLLAALMILPELPFFQSAATRRERAALQREGEELVKLARDLEKRQEGQKPNEILRQVALNLKALGKQMQEARLDRKKALVRLHELEKEIALAKKEILGSLSAKSLAAAAAQMKTGQEELAAARLKQRSEVLAQLKSGLSSQAGEAEGEARSLTEEQRKALERLAESLKTSQCRQLLDLDADLASIIAELLAKGDVQEALEILSRLANKLADEETLRQLSPEELEQLAEELRRLAEALKETDLDALAKELLEMAKALERGDLQRCRESAGRACRIGLGLGEKCGAALSLNAALRGLGACAGGLSGRGVGPGDGRAKYDPGAAHNVNRGEPARIPTQHYPTRIPGQTGEKGISHSIQILGQPDQPGEAQVPYYEVYSDYSKVAENALEREEVPASHRERVKTYFESLKPDSE
ncbi:MAG: hypothetical protein GTO55_10100 [Armatimonadetes bacterium]|nr:hypothetical protein [Armatimonadota bacterium]NIM24593.1 hypothetical protein [Armatimonadota bacterium]NIM68469.1 hypothetical protein [Armatimonadota bacterium]NIM76855.1 hypothetical protein [Armatimonadota bacterium]NIN06666.1 hypothetical protein [Armatimonadota bacterium]